jgi:hypothetical protein
LRQAQADHPLTLTPDHLIGGWPFYDADGTGSKAAVKFTVIENLAKLTAANFLVI